MHMSFLNLLAPRKNDRDARPPNSRVATSDPTCSTKALKKFLTCLTRGDSPVLLDLGPVVGTNLNFFGDRLGCKIFVEDLFTDLDRHSRTGNLAAFPPFLEKRLTQPAGGVDGILCWDLFDYLDKGSAQVLASQLMRVLAPEGALLAFFGTAPSGDARYTEFVIVDELNLRHSKYPASRVRQASVPNRDILRLFSGLRVSESFLLKNNQREILFRKPS